ncbi:MAG: LCP family protein [Eubacterium sp.]|nr:LCP family protein [Eubacterium sp.]
MKIFKNRGDFYISKSSFSASKQAKILYALLVLIVAFTIVLVIMLHAKYPSAALFFSDGEVSTTEVTEEGEEEEEPQEALPEISGKTNFLIYETDDDNTSFHWLCLIQADKDNLSYKVVSLPLDMKIDKESISDIYSISGGAGLQKKLTEYFGFEIDYYAGFEYNDFVEFANKLGTFVYPSIEEVVYSGGKKDDKYSLHINEGEQTINAKELTNLLRYYSQKEKNYALENEIALRALTSLLNGDNFEDCDSLFKLFVKNTSTDISVRDFENSRDALMVFCKRNGDVTLYSSNPELEGEILTQKSVKDIKGYFSK